MICVLSRCIACLVMLVDVDRRDMRSGIVIRGLFCSFSCTSETMSAMLVKMGWRGKGVKGVRAVADEVLNFL